MGLLTSPTVKDIQMTKNKQKTMDIVMTKEHLGESIQQHLRAFGYFQNDDEYFDLKNVEVQPNGTVLIQGRME